MSGREGKRGSGGWTRVFSKRDVSTFDRKSGLIMRLDKPTHEYACCFQKIDRSFPQRARAIAGWRGKGEAVSEGCTRLARSRRVLGQTNALIFDTLSRVFETFMRSFAAHAARNTTATKVHACPRAFEQYASENVGVLCRR